MKKSQSSIEFVIFSGIIVFFLTIFFLAIGEAKGEKIKEEKRIRVQNLAYAIENEIQLAATSREGYYRKFEIPDEIAGMAYEAIITENVVYVKTNDGKYAIALPIPNATGQIIKGENIIKKENNLIIINP